MKKHNAPIIAALLLFLPVLYVVSYLALVRPDKFGGVYDPASNYRFASPLAKRINWPLEQIDRKLRPERGAHKC